MKKMADVFQMSEEQMKSMKMFEIRNMVIETGIRILEFLIIEEASGNIKESTSIKKFRHLVSVRWCAGQA